MKKSDFGNRMKEYEHISTGRKLMPNLPVIARLDGKAFHTFCKHFDKPFDAGFMWTMIDVAKYLVEKTHALIGYIQSDEITLIWRNDYHAPMMFDGKLHKLNSVLASMATGVFNDVIKNYHKTSPAFFDCRTWNVPNEIEACNVLLWREQDATRNSIQMLGQANFSHKELHKKSCVMIQDMLHEKNINWNVLAPAKKRGTYVRREGVYRTLSVEELSKLPEKHEARKNPNLQVRRHKMNIMTMPPFGKVSNKTKVVFEGDTPYVEHDYDDINCICDDCK